MLRNSEDEKVVNLPHVNNSPRSLDVVVVNWNSGTHLRRCVASLQRFFGGGATWRLFIVDNASHDGSAALDVTAGLPMEVIRNARNLGFAAACNQGAGRGTAPLLLFLNPDVEVEAGTFGGLAERLVADGAARIGIIGVQMIDGDGSVQRSCARLPTPGSMVAQALALDRMVPWLAHSHFMREWGHDDTRTVDQVIGAFILMQRCDFESLGGFDERYFVYMEDVDLACRAKAAGLASLFVHDRRVRHAGGGTTGQIRDIRLAYLMRSRVLYARKHFGRPHAMVATAAIMVVEPAVRLLAALLRWRLPDARAILSAVRLCWQRYPFSRADQLGEITHGSDRAA